MNFINKPRARAGISGLTAGLAMFGLLSSPIGFNLAPRAQAAVLHAPYPFTEVDSVLIDGARATSSAAMDSATAARRARQFYVDPGMVWLDDQTHRQDPLRRRRALRPGDTDLLQRLGRRPVRATTATPSVPPTSVTSARRSRRAATAASPAVLALPR